MFSGSREFTGIDRVSLPQDAMLIFSFPPLADSLGPLYIRSGANAIKWGYQLNTLATPTLGGEVVQVLSALVGPMQITGQTAGLQTAQANKLAVLKKLGWGHDSGGRDNYTPYDELRAISLWFQSYMEWAGSTTHGNKHRVERAVLFQYPARGWSFYLFPTAIDGFRYDNETISPEWSLTAEIVSDNALDYFSGVTMSSFNDDILTNQSLISQIGLSYFGRTGTETKNFAFGQTGGSGSTDPFLNPDLKGSSVTQLARTMGDNFQRLVAAWASGNLTGFELGSVLDNGALPKSVDDVYSNLFGGGSGSGGGTGGGGTGSSGGGGSGNPVAPSDIILNIASSFETVQIAGKLGVATAIVESGLNPDDRTPNDGGAGIDGVGLFMVHYGGRKSTPDVHDASVSFRNDAVTAHYPVGEQISDAASWFPDYTDGQNYLNASDEALAELAARAQGPNDPSGYVSKILAVLGQAQSLIDQSKNQGTSNGGSGPSWAVNKMGVIDYHGPMTPSRVIIHSAESDGDPSGLASFWAGQGLGYGAHMSVGADGTTVRFAPDNQVTWHTGGNNTGSLGVEMMGFAAWTKDQWANRNAQFEAVAKLIAYWCSTYDIPVVASIESGISTHAMNSAVFPASQGHYDPGPHYPFDDLLARVKELVG